MAGLALFAAVSARPARAAAAPFDGAWTVIVACARAPDGALPYNWRLSAEIRDGSLLGNYNQPGMVPSGTLSGNIDAKGDALLLMRGLTGNSNYTLHRVTPGTPFEYTVTAHFEPNHGAGKRNIGRSCDLDFSRQ